MTKDCSCLYLSVRGQHCFSGAVCFLRSKPTVAGLSTSHPDRCIGSRRRLSLATVVPSTWNKHLERTRMESISDGNLHPLVDKTIETVHVVEPAAPHTATVIFLHVCPYFPLYTVYSSGDYRAPATKGSPSCPMQKSSAIMKTLDSHISNGYSLLRTSLSDLCDFRGFTSDLAERGRVKQTLSLFLAGE